MGTTAAGQPPLDYAALDWKTLLAPYKRPSPWRSAYQLANTAVPFATLWAVMWWSLRFSYAWTLLLAVPTSLLLVRLFILQHDCGHGSFFRSRRANNALGFLLGVLTLIPYTYWRKTHAIHHATSGDLDHRSFGDIDTLTIREYLSLSPANRLRYRLYRHPLVLLLVGPAYQFIVKHRFPADTPRGWTREWRSVHLTNVALLGVVVLAWLTIGIGAFIKIQLPITILSGSIGVFLFYVQHQYEDTYWRYREAWDYYSAGMLGSSHLEMPKWLQWFTGNIGLHHIHHVCSLIPNYYLQRCVDENPELRAPTRINLRQAVRTLGMTLWDEGERQLVGFRDLPRIEARLAAAESTAVPEGKAGAVPRAWQESKK